MAKRTKKHRISTAPLYSAITALAMVLGLSVGAIYLADLAQERRMSLLAMVAVELGLLEVAAILLRRFLKNKRADDDRLRDSEEFARSVVDALQTQIAIVDSGGVVLATNRAWREFSELGGEENDRVPEGANYLAYCDQASGAKRDARTGAIAAGIRSIAREAEKEFSIEYAVAMKKERRWFSAAVTRFPGEGPVRLVVSHEDITRRKSAEEEVNKTREEAELANLAKSAFLANTSHEIRTPMNAILGYAEMLLDPKQSDQQRRNSALTIRRNGEHLLAIINDILDISKIEAQKMTVEKLSCDLQQLVTDLIGLTRPWAEKKGLTFEIEFDKMIPKQIQTDPLRAKQVLVNLVGNAIKFTESGKIKIGVYREISYFAHTIRFEVTDTGIGMSPAQMEKLFQPFTQADVSTTRRFGGTGLGLTISKRMAKLLGGDITVKSEPGTGSTFTFRLDGGPRLGVPLIENLTMEQLTVGEIETKDEEIQIQGSILLAEDGEDNRELVISHLHGAGAQVAIATTGRLAVEACKTQKFDLILMDMQMPELDGYGACRALRASGMRIPIIALTANAMAEDRRRCMEAGCTDYLSKPITRGVLLRMLAKYLNSPSHAPANGQASNGPVGDPATISKLTAGFIQRLPSRVSTMQRLLVEQNFLQLQDAVHQIKGAAGGYGFQSISEVAGRAEQKIKDKVPFQEIRSEIDSLISLIRSVGGYQLSREGFTSEAA